MNKTEGMEIKNRKGQRKDNKLTKVNKRRRSDNKRPAEEGRREADEISKAFPNFSVLTREERLAFFQALTTARKNVERKGIPTRERFGTVHDEYLNYFNQDEEEKQEEEFIKSSSTLCDDGEDSCIDQFNGRVDEEDLEEEKCKSPTLQDAVSTPPRTPRDSSAPDTFDSMLWEQQESVIQLDTNKLVDIFLKKKKKYEAGYDNLHYVWAKSEKIPKQRKIKKDKRSMKESRWVARTLPEEMKTPQFDALTVEEKQIFFKILQEAHDNILKKNPDKEREILPMDAIIRRYQGGREVTNIYATTHQNTLGYEEVKKDLKVTVTVTSKDNERLFRTHSQPQVYDSEEDNLESESFQTIGQMPKSPSTTDDEGSEESSESEKAITKSKKLKNETEEENFKRSATPPGKKNEGPSNPREAETPPDKLCTEKFDSSRTPPEQRETKPNKSVSETKQKKCPKGKQKSETPRGEQKSADLSVYSAERCPVRREAGSIHLTGKSFGEAEELDGWSLTSTSVKKKVKKPASPIAGASKENTKGIRSREKLQEGVGGPMEQEVSEEGLEKRTKTVMAVKQPDLERVLSREIPLLCENFKEKHAEVKAEEDENGGEQTKKQKEEEVTGEIREEGCFKEKHPGKDRAEIQEFTLNRVLLVNDDVVGKIKGLIYYLEAKTKRDAHLEKEYLKLLVDYADYLSKVLESLVLRKEGRHKQKKNTLVAASLTHISDSKTKGKTKREEPELPPTSVSDRDFVKKYPSPSQTKENVQDTPTELDRKSDLNLPVLSDSESSSDSEGETRFMRRRAERERILTTKIRLLQDLLRQRAEFVDGDFADFKIVHHPEKEFVPKDKPPTVQLLVDDDEAHAQQENKMKFFKALLKFCTCGKKKTPEEGIFENLKGEAVRVDVADTKKDAASATLNQATMEVLKAAERKKIIEKYYAKD